MGDFSASSASFREHSGRTILPPLPAAGHYKLTMTLLVVILKNICDPFIVDPSHVDLE